MPRALDYLQSEGTTVLSKAHEVENIKRAILIEHSDSGSISLINAGSDAVNSIVSVNASALQRFSELVVKKNQFKKGQ